MKQMGPPNPLTATVVAEAISILKQVLPLQDENKIQELIQKFQNLIWNHAGNGHAADILQQLAQDLDYFESDPNKRAESASYFGKGKALTLVQAGLGELARTSPTRTA